MDNNTLVDLPPHHPSGAIASKFGKNCYDEMVLLKQFTADIDPVIEPHPYNPHDLEDIFDALAYEIRTTGKIITV